MRARYRCGDFATYLIAASLLKDLVDEYSLKVLNFSDQCTGKWTRCEFKKGVLEKSVLDYAVTSEILAGYLEKFTIDEERVISPYWVRKNKKSGDARVFSDHNALLFNLCIPCGKCTDRSCPDVSGSNGWYVTPDGIQ